MSHRNKSEKPETLVFGPFGPRNLGQVYQFVECSPSIGAGERSRLLWALRMLAGLHRAIEAQPEMDVLAKIPTNVPLLRNYLRRAHALRQQYTAGTWRNMRWGIFTALRASGVRLRQNGRRVRLPDAWQCLIDQLPERQRTVLYPFACRCVEDGIAPGGVTQALFDRYEQFLNEFDGRANRRRAYLDVCNAWNFARFHVSSWPAVGTTPASKYDRYILPWEAFAPSFSADVQRMLHEALNPDRSVSGRRRIKPATAEHQGTMLRRIASALVAETKRDAKTITGVADLVDPAAARDALRFLARRDHERKAKRGAHVSNPQ